MILSILLQSKTFWPKTILLLVNSFWFGAKGCLTLLQERNLNVSCEHIGKWWSFYLHSRFNVVFVLFALGWHFDRVAFADDADITFQVALGAAGEVVGVAQQGPLVVELVVCGPRTLLAAVVTSYYLWPLPGCQGKENHPFAGGHAKEPAKNKSCTN